METTILFWTMIAGACAYAVVLGGWEGKWTAGIFITASAASYAVNRWFYLFWHKTNLSMFAVDFATLLAFYLIAARSRHWWPLWVVAFQLNAVAAHLATMINRDFANAVYRGYGGLWAIPCILVMVYGIWRDRSGGQRLEFV